MSMLDLAMTIYSPSSGSILCSDVVTAAGGASSPIYSLKYEDTPDGCGAGSIDVGLYYEQFFDLGYWAYKNLVEIYSGDNTLTAFAPALSSGSQKYYVDNVWTVDPARGEDAQQLYFNDGVNKTMFCKMLGIGFDNAPSIRNSNSITTTTAATTITTTFPSPAAGNRLVAILSSGGAFALTASAPAGWTSDGSAFWNADLLLAAWNKTATGSETSLTITLSHAATATLTVLEIAGSNTLSFTFSGSNVVSGPCQQTPTVTNQPVGTLLIGAYTIDSGAALSPPYGWNFPIANNPNPSSAQNYPLALAAVQVTDANPYTGFGSWNDTNGTNLNGCTLIIKATPSGTPVPWMNVQVPGGVGSIPAYAPGTIVGRRRYIGQIAKRTRPNSKIPGGTITLTGLQTALQGVLGTFLVALASAQDVSAICWQAFVQFAASHLPFLNIPTTVTPAQQAQFPTTGSLYSGNNTQITLDQFLAYVVAAIVNGDQWNLRIGHDSSPRLVKYYDGPTNSYVYNLSLDQSSWSYSALGVEVTDEDTSNLYNAVEVIGATDATGNVVSAIVLNTTEISALGYQIDGPPQYNNACLTTAACEAQAAQLLEQNSIAASSQKCTIYTHDDVVVSSAAPGGLQRGDVVRGGANLTITGFPGDAPNIFGLVLSVTTTLDFQKMESQQDVSFEAIVPDYATAAREQANALATALTANAQPGVGLDQFFVGQNAFSFTVSGLVVTTPLFKAVFALGSLPIQCGGNTFTLTASANNYVWLNPDTSWTVKVNDISPIVGSIPYAEFWTNATTVVGYQPRAQTGLLDIPASYFLTTPWTPALSGVSATPAPSVDGLTCSVALTFTVTNEPVDGSLSRINLYFRPNGTTRWTGASGVAAKTGPSATYTSLTINDLTVGINYDFGITGEALSGDYETAVIVIASNVNPGAVQLPNAYMLSTSATPTISAVTITSVPNNNGATAKGSLSAVASLTFTTTQPVDGSLSRISLYVAISGSGNYGYVGSVPAQGATGGTPPSSATYTGLQIPNLTNGVAYDFAIAFENAGGGEGPVTYVGTSTVVALAITTQYLVGGTPVTPTTTGGTISSVPTLPGIVGRVLLGFTCTNQPVDGSFSGVLVFQRAHGSPSSAWSNVFFIPTTTPTTPSASGTYSCELPEVSAGVAFDFGVAYESTQGSRGTILAPTALQNFTPQAIAIANSYMLGNVAAAAPTFSTSSVTSAASVDGLSADVEVTLTTNNQPTDQSLSRLNFWYRSTVPGTSPTSSQGWTSAGGLPSGGVGSTSPASSYSYTFDFIGLVNGTQYWFGASYEDNQGDETQIGTIGSITAQTIGIPNQYLTEGALITPTISGSATFTLTAGRFVSQLAVKFTANNQPTDGSLSKIIAYYRQSGQPTWLQLATSAPRNTTTGADGNGAILTGGAVSASGTYNFVLPEASNGVTYEFGFSYESNRGSESAVTSLGTSAPSSSVPSGATVSTGTATFTAPSGSGGAGSIVLNVTIPYTISGTSATNWIAGINVLSGFYDPSILGQASVLTSVPIAPGGAGLSGNVNFGVTLIPNSGGPTTYRYYFFVQFVAVDGTVLNGTAVIYTHA